MGTIDVRQLRAFVAIAEEEHITRATEHLDMQQPPLTRWLQGLEDELGVMRSDVTPKPDLLSDPVLREPMLVSLPLGHAYAVESDGSGLTADISGQSPSSK